MGPDYKPVMRANRTVILNVRHLQKLEIEIYCCRYLVWLGVAMAMCSLLSFVDIHGTALNSVPFAQFGTSVESPIQWLVNCFKHVAFHVQYQGRST